MGVLEDEWKKYTDVFKSGGNILDHSASRYQNKLFIIKCPLRLMEFNDKQFILTLWSTLV